MNKRQTGNEKELQAAAYLEEQGMQIVEHNFRNRQGEIDLIGMHQGYLVFVEVKYRSNIEKGYALSAVDFRKQRQICKVADFYRVSHHVGTNVGVRYDVVGIQGDEISWIQNAFPHVYTHG